MAKAGRPSLYSEEIADRICEELMLGRSLRAICEEEAWCAEFRTVIGWLARDVGDFRTKYAEARLVQADVHADDIVLIADRPELGEIETERSTPDGTYYETKRADMIEHRKMRIAARQWTAEKLRPKAYGVRQMVEHAGHMRIDVGDTGDDELVGEIMNLLATGRLKLPGGVELAEVDDETPEEEDDDPYGVG